eukprot:gene5155-6416_t
MYSTDAAKHKVYELRTYSFHPEHYPSFLSLLKDNIHLRTKHSPLSACWTSELGGMNQAVFLWPYDSLDQRADVREKLAADTEWNGFLSKLRPMLQKQENVILREFPWAPLEELSESKLKENKVWELRTYTAQPGKTNKWAEEFRKGFDERKKFSAPVGVFYSEIGPLNAIVHLWPYKTFTERTNIRNTCLENPIWVQTVQNTMTVIDKMENKTLIPIFFDKK